MFSTLFLLIACSPSVEILPFAGPDGTSTVVTDRTEVLVATTHLQVRNAPGPGRRFGDHADAVATHLYDNQPEGWLGSGFRNKGQLHWWTLSVWESEEAMNAFVLSEPHVTAMSALTDVAAAAWSRAEWMPTEDAPPSWESIVERLETAPDFEYVR